MEDMNSEEFKRKIRHHIIDKHILVETLLNNLCSNYFCDSINTSKEFLFLVMQKEYSFKRKIELLEDLKLYEKDYITCSKKEYKRGLKFLEWVNIQRNNIAHNFMFFGNKRNIMINVVKKGNVKRISIDKTFLKELDKKIKGAISFLSGLNLEIASYKGFIKDGSKNMVDYE